MYQLSIVKVRVESVLDSKMAPVAGTPTAVPLPEEDTAVGILMLAAVPKSGSVFP